MRRTTKKWIHNTANRPDSERVHSVAMGLKVRRWIEAWEFVRKCKAWTDISALPVSVIFTTSYRVDTIKRLRRRILQSFHAAGLVELSPWPACPGIVTQFRVRRIRPKLNPFDHPLAQNRKTAAQSPNVTPPGAQKT